MARSAADAVAWARANARRQSSANGSWDGWCAALVYNAGGFPNYYGSAIAAFAASQKIGAVDPNPATARPGEVHYWNNVIVRGQEAGHVAIETGGNVVLMASAAVDTNFGHDSGLISLARYKAKRSAPRYLGHAPRFGQWAANVTAPAGGSITPVPAQKRSPGMYLFHITSGEVYLVTDNGFTHIQSEAHLNLFRRMFNSYPGYDTFNAAERDIVSFYIAAANTSDDVETAKILEAVGKIGTVTPTISQADIVAALKSAGLPTTEGVAAAVADNLAKRLAQ